MPPPTERQLRQLVRWLAVVYLEVERGLRPPTHLAPLFTKAGFRRFNATSRPARRQGKPVLPDDLGTIVLAPLGHRGLTATVPTREPDDRWGALILELRIDRQGHLALTQIQRPPREAQRLLHAPPPAREHDAQLAERIARIQDERRLVAAAHRAALTCLQDPTGDPRGPAALREHLVLWAQRLTELDRELYQLLNRQHIREQLESGIVDEQQNEPTAVPDCGRANSQSTGSVVTTHALSVAEPTSDAAPPATPMDIGR